MEKEAVVVESQSTAEIYLYSEGAEVYFIEMVDRLDYMRQVLDVAFALTID